MTWKRANMIAVFDDKKTGVQIKYHVSFSV